jgi:hypothetical protein
MQTPTHQRARARRVLSVFGSLVLLCAALMATTATSASAAPSCTATHTLAWCTSYYADREYSNSDGHKYEKPLGSNCNYFTTSAWHASGATACSGGYWSEEWCMDMSRWVYKTAGASVANITHLAYSAKNYSTYKTYASGRRPKIGDLAVWAKESHVGIVTAVSGSTATVVSGNSYNPARGDYTAIYKANYAASTFQGFAAPKLA